jgi:hypothetical protein
MKMQTHKINISAYFSHPIRGERGPEATVEDMALNNDMAALMSHCVENVLPALDLYVPAIHDEYVVEAYLRKSQTEFEILEIDKAILRRRDILIVFANNGVISHGMQIEIDDAVLHAIPIFQFSYIWEIPKMCQDILDWYYKMHTC